MLVGVAVLVLARLGAGGTERFGGGWSVLWRRWQHSSDTATGPGGREEQGT